MAACILLSLRLCNSAIALQQTVEMHDIQCGRQLLSNINPTVWKAASLDVHVPASNETARSMNKKLHFILVCKPYFKKSTAIRYQQWQWMIYHHQFVFENRLYRHPRTLVFCCNCLWWEFIITNKENIIHDMAGRNGFSTLKWSTDTVWIGGLVYFHWHTKQQQKYDIVYAKPNFL